MKTLLAAATAFVLLTGGAMAQTASNCDNPNSKGVQGQNQGAGAAAGEAAGGTSCETVVQPDGKATVQNGPTVNAAGANTAPHEAGSGGNGAAK